jgi:diguanylate cyclase (GGDEF)-like protein
MTRASTLLLALLTINTLLGILCLVVAAKPRDSKGLRFWGWGLLTYSVGILITIPEFLPFDARKVVGNALIAYAPILSVQGVLAFTRFRLDHRWTTAGFILSVLPIVYNHVGDHYVAMVDFLSPAPIANILFIVGAVLLLGNDDPATRNAARFLAGILLFSVFVWSLRMLALWQSLGGSNDRERGDLTIALFAIAQIVIAVAATLGLLWVEVLKMEEALRRQAYCDALTGLPNRRATVERFEQEAERAGRDRRAFALVVFDVDHFKRINDNLGHQAGDAALQHLARILDRAKAGVDTVGRIGGEEFVVLLTGRQADELVEAAEGLRRAIEKAPSTEQVPPVTVSGGVAIFPKDGDNWDQLFATADRRLYAAKNAGRNRIEGPIAA